jgi:transposase
VVLEACCHSPWLSRLLHELGFEVVVANPRQLKLIFKSKRKNDPIDSERLARLGRVDTELLSPIRHRSEAVQRDLHVLKSRDTLVGTRTRLVSHIRSVVKSLGGRIPLKVRAETFHRSSKEHVPEALVPSVEPLLRVLESIDLEIKQLDRQIHQLCKEAYPETEMLRQVTGVGEIVALTFVLVIEDPRRFERSRDVAAYLGLVPRQWQSGAVDRNLHITKTGDRFLRKLLVQSANYILGPFGPDSDLRRWGEQLTERGGRGASKRARVAIARKLSVLLHHLWVTGQVYAPNRQPVPSVAA